jgi:hypothetical protein
MIRCCNARTKLMWSMEHPSIPQFHGNPQKVDCFNFVAPLWYGRNWPWSSEKGGNEFGSKSEYF